MYLGEHKFTKKEVAVKILDKTLLGDKGLEMARSEIQILKICQHPNIIRLLDLFENFSNIYLGTSIFISFHLVLELLEGGDLYSYLHN